MKLLYALLSCFLSFALFAQDSTKIEENKLKKHQIGLTYSPEYTFRYLQADSKSAWVMQIADSMEVPKFGFSTGLNYVYNVNDKLNINTGIFFTDNGEKTKYNVNIQPVNYTNHYYFVSIPVRINYTMYTKKVALYSSIGLTGNVFINHRTVMFEEGKKEAIQFNNSNDLTRWNIGGVAGLGMQAKLSENWFFKLEVLYKQSISAVNNDPVKKWLYAVGPNFGLFYNFQ